jgi:transcriptional regulator
MYVPTLFAEDRPEELQAIIRSSALPVLVSLLRDDDGARMVATHLPLTLDGERLVGHIARANKQWRLLDTTAESFAIFSGVDGYVSPSYYATKQETGRVVPTWNYEAVHVYGRLEIIEDTARILEVVTNLTNRYEQPRQKPWKVSDAPDDYIASQLRAIVAVVLHITKMIGVRKLSQNKTTADRDGVVAGQTVDNPALAERMVLALEEPGTKLHEPRDLAMAEQNKPLNAPDWVKDHVSRYLASDGADGYLWDASLGGGKGMIATLLLTTVGRKSGRTLTLPLIFGRSGPNYVVVASKGGAPAHPAWYLNIQGDPEVQVQVKAEKFKARAFTAGPEERAALWAKMVEIYAPYAQYQTKTEREIPVVLLKPI